MAKKDNTQVAGLDTKELYKKLQEAQKTKRESLTQLKTGKTTAHKEYISTRKLVARIKTELAKRN